MNRKPERRGTGAQGRRRDETRGKIKGYTSSASSRRGKVKQSLKDIARERIGQLFQHAESTFKKHPEDAQKAVKRARSIGMKFRVHMPKSVKRKYCKKCGSFLKSGVNCTVRLNQKKQPHIVITCKGCGTVMRIPYKK